MKMNLELQTNENQRDCSSLTLSIKQGSHGTGMRIIHNPSPWLSIHMNSRIVRHSFSYESITKNEIKLEGPEKLPVNEERSLV